MGMNEIMDQEVETKIVHSGSKKRKDKKRKKVYSSTEPKIVEVHIHCCIIM